MASNSKTPVALVGLCMSDGAGHKSQTNGVDADGRRRQVDSHLPSTMVPGRLDAGRPGQRSLTVLAVAQATSGDVVRLT